MTSDSDDKDLVKIDNIVYELLNLLNSHSPTTGEAMLIAGAFLCIVCECGRVKEADFDELMNELKKEYKEVTNDELF